MKNFELLYTLRYKMTVNGKKTEFWKIKLKVTKKIIHRAATEVTNFRSKPAEPKTKLLS